MSDQDDQIIMGLRNQIYSFRVKLEAEEKLRRELERKQKMALELVNAILNSNKKFAEYRATEENFILSIDRAINQVRAFKHKLKELTNPEWSEGSFKLDSEWEHPCTWKKIEDRKYELQISQQAREDILECIGYSQDDDPESLSTWAMLYELEDGEFYLIGYGDIYIDGEDRVFFNLDKTGAEKEAENREKWGPQ